MAPAGDDDVDPGLLQLPPFIFGHVLLEIERSPQRQVRRDGPDTPLFVVAGPRPGDVAGRRDRDVPAGARVEHLQPGVVHGGGSGIPAGLIPHPFAGHLRREAGGRVENGDAMVAFGVHDERELGRLHLLVGEDPRLVQPDDVGGGDDGHSNSCSRP